jgi:hypothetical protein
MSLMLLILWRGHYATLSPLWREPLLYLIQSWVTVRWGLENNVERTRFHLFPILLQHRSEPAHERRDQALKGNLRFPRRLGLARR